MLVDTNVLSQLTRRHGDEGVKRWIDANFDDLLVPAIVISELMYGAYKNADPAQRGQLIDVTTALILDLAGKIEPFGAEDAQLHGRLTGESARAGKSLPASDSMVLAMAITRGVPVATRNLKHFEGFGLELIDPWRA